MPGDTITWAKGTFDSPQGEITVDWSIQDDHLTITADIPGGSQAQVRFLDGTTYHTGPGHFSRRRPIS